MKGRYSPHIKLFLVVVLITLVVLITMAVVASVSFAETQQSATDKKTGRFVFGAALGIQDDTADGTAAALGLYGDYYLTQAFSIGPLLQMGFTNDLFQLGLSAQAKYTFSLMDIPKLKPHVEAGIGIIHADLDNWSTKDKDDTSYLIPIGLGVEYKLTPSVSLDTTLFFNTTNLDVRDEDFFTTWLIGLRFPF